MGQAHQLAVEVDGVSYEVQLGSEDRARLPSLKVNREPKSCLRIMRTQKHSLICAIVLAADFFRFATY